MLRIPLVFKDGFLVLAGRSFCLFLFRYYLSVSSGSLSVGDKATPVASRSGVARTTVGQVHAFWSSEPESWSET